MKKRESFFYDWGELASYMYAFMATVEENRGSMKSHCTIDKMLGLAITA
jgi:hypothetical protein